MPLSRRQLAWAAIALLGLAVPAVLTWSITQLTGQHIGLAAQPLSVVRSLAPAGRDSATVSESPGLTLHPRPGRGRHRHRASSLPPAADPRATPPSAPAAVASTPGVPALSPPVSSGSTAPPAPASQTSAAGSGVRSQPFGRQRASGSQSRDDSSGGSSSGPDD